MSFSCSHFPSKTLLGTSKQRHWGTATLSSIWHATHRVLASWDNRGVPLQAQGRGRVETCSASLWQRFFSLVHYALSKTLLEEWIQLWFHFLCNSFGMLSLPMYAFLLWIRPSYFVTVLICFEICDGFLRFFFFFKDLTSEWTFNDNFWSCCDTMFHFFFLQINEVK